MYKFGVVCRCIKDAAVYGIKQGNTYIGIGELQPNGKVDYAMYTENSNEKPELFTSGFFDYYFEIVFVT